jgi:hypothetical protein
MKLSPFHLVGFLWATAALSAPAVYPGCASPSAKPNHTFVIDPVNGSPQGDGSAAHPWNSLQAVFAPVGTVGPLLSTVPYPHRDATGADVNAPNPDATIHPGDEIMLMNGSYGDLHVSRAVNTDFVTVAAAPGQAPVLGAITVRNSTKLVLSGLTFQKLNASGSILFLSYFSGDNDIVFSGNNLLSQPDVSAWSIADWIGLAPTAGIFVGYQRGASQNCFAITSNTIKNIRNGVNITADNLLFDSNTVDNFGDDATDVAGTNVTYSRNVETNSHDLLDGNHNDFLQMTVAAFEPPGGPTTWFTNWVIDSNVFVDQTVPNLPFPADGSGYPSPTVGTGVQCIGVSYLNGAKITNNVCVISIFNGIWGGSLQNAVIADNTILGSNPAHPANIGGLTNSANVTVRNNITTGMINLKSIAPVVPSRYPRPLTYLPGSGIVLDNNRTLSPVAATQAVQRILAGLPAGLAAVHSGVRATTR